jgi:hypothetical protein
MKIGVTYDKAHRTVASGKFMYHFVNQETFLNTTIIIKLDDDYAII